MTAAEIASYLVSLHTLMDAQTRGVKSTASPFLANEYERQWGKLEEAINKEKDDEARKR